MKTTATEIIKTLSKISALADGEYELNLKINVTITHIQVPSGRCKCVAYHLNRESASIRTWDQWSDLEKFWILKTLAEKY